MLAVHHFAGFAPAMLKRLMRTLLAALAVVLMLAFASGTSWAQRVIDAPNIQAPPGSTMLPPPDDPDPQPSYYDAATGVSISAPSTMAPGSTAYVTVTIRNSGTTTWYPGVANPYRLGSQNPQDNTTWGVGRVELGSTVAPGGNAVFGFTITAPSTPGTYAFGWAMLREGMYWFGGNISSSITVAVPPPVYDAQLISASVPSSMTAGSYYNVSMTLKNTGNTTWTSPDFSLANTDDNYTFGPNRVAMSPSTVAPGQSSTFNFQVRAPATAGSYTFQWGMVWEYHQRFGQNSTTYITVSAPAPVTPRPTISVSRPSLTAGQSFTTSWSTTDATSLTHVCTSSGTGYTVNESLAVNGSRALTAQSAWVGYPSSCTWTASGAGGSATYTETMTTVAAAVNGSVTYVHTDGLGSPVAKTDSNGTVISRTRYEPYGYVASGDQPTIGFTGHVNDVDTGLTYMQQRYYDPVAGRFLSIDPVVTDANTGGSFNRYVYANNSPYKYVDPDGRQERAAEALGDQFRNDMASGNSGIYKPFEKPVIAVTVGMIVGPPIAAAMIAGAPAEAAVAAGVAGKTTSIVAKNGVEIKSIARHAVDRAIGDGGKRAGVGPQGILDSLKNPLKITETKTDELGRASQRFIGKDATTAVNPETGKIVSLNPTSTKTAEKLIKAAEQ